MLKTRIDESQSAGLLVLEGELTVVHAEELRRVFLEALGTRNALDVDLEGVSETDLFGLQVLCAAHRSAMKSGKELSFSGGKPESLCAALEASGFGRLTGCAANATCPWNRE